MRESQESTKATILIVNDEENLAHSFATALQREGYATAEASNGQDALAWLGSHPMPDLILLDIIMPVMDGFEFLQLKQDDPILSNIPVVVLQHRATDAAVDRAWIEDLQNQGVDAWLHIPCTPTAVVRIVAQRLNGQTGTLPDD